MSPYNLQIIPNAYFLEIVICILEPITMFLWKSMMILIGPHF
jgi:hypothetical protein